MTSPSQSISKRQQQVLDVIRKHWIEHLTPPPSARYITKQIYGSTSAVSVVWYALNRLEELGLIRIVTHSLGSRLPIPTEFIPKLEEALHDT